MTEDKPLKILLVEDDKNLGILLCEFLIVKGYDAALATDGKEGLEFFRNGKYDLCILDVMMPKMDGYALAKEIRLADPKIPIIFLTAKSMKEDTLEGFKSGADDYITKPFSMEELLYRIKAVSKRSNLNRVENENLTFQLGKYLFDPNSQTLENNGESRRLTSKENQLLKILCQNKNQAVQRETALKLIWGDDTYFNARSMDVYISKLRKKFSGDESIEIVNIHGKGFKLIQKKL